MNAHRVDKPLDASDMNFSDVAIDRQAEVPIGVQLAWALRSRIGDGQLAPGERLPGLREMADAVGMNVNTVRAVYQRLEQEGLIDSQQGSGTFVATTPQQSSAVGTIAASAAREALETGVDPRDVAAALYVSPESPSAEDSEAAERRRLLRTQIAALERALVDMEASHPGVAPVPGGERKGVGPTLLTAAELEQVRTQLVRRLATVQAAIDEHTVAEERESAASRARAHANAKARAKTEARVKATQTSRKPDPATTEATPSKRSPRPRPASRPATART